MFNTSYPAVFIGRPRTTFLMTFANTMSLYMLGDKINKMWRELDADATPA